MTISTRNFRKPKLFSANVHQNAHSTPINNMYVFFFFGGLHGRTNQNLQALGGLGHHRRLHLHQSHAEQATPPKSIKEAPPGPLPSYLNPPGFLRAGAVSQGLNRDSLKSLCHSRLSGQKAVAPYPSGAGVLAASTQCVASSEGEVLGGEKPRF